MPPGRPSALIENPAVRVLDASTAFRTHPDWAYGFPELTPEQADRIRTSKRVSNPGCYPTGALALLRPLVDAGLLPSETPISVHAVSGYSGGGRQLIEAFEGRGPELISDAHRIYGLDLAHKHRNEMKVHSGLAHVPLFSPSVGRFRQGMLVQIPLHLWSLPKTPSGQALQELLAARYDGQRFLRVMPFEPHPKTLAPEALNGTNLLELFVFANSSEQTALLVARLDNLGKGASGRGRAEYRSDAGPARPARLPPGSLKVSSPHFRDRYALLRRTFTLLFCCQISLLGGA